MGIEYGYRRMSESELEALEADPMHAITVLFQPPGIDPELMSQLLTNPEALKEGGAEILASLANAPADTTRVDLGKDCHALHFLLTGDASLEPAHDPDNPLHNVAMGGHPTTIPASYGPVRCLSQVDVSDIVRDLSAISTEELRSRFSAAEFNAAKIYPRPRPAVGMKTRSKACFSYFPG